MASRKYLELARIGPHVIDRDPYAAHVACRERGQMNRILMRILLAAEKVGERLAGPWRGTENDLQHTLNRLVLPQPADSRVNRVQMFHAIAGSPFSAVDSPRHRVIQLDLDLKQKVRIDRILHHDEAALDEIPQPGD